MDCAIKLNSQLDLKAEEIQHITSNWMLPAEFITPQAFITQLLPHQCFCHCGILSELAATFNE